MAYVNALEAVVAENRPDDVQRSADAQTLLEGMFRRAADDLQHVARTMPGAVTNWQPPARQDA